MPRYEPHIPLTPAGNARQPTKRLCTLKTLKTLKDLLPRRSRDHQADRIRTWEKVPFAEQVPLFIDIPTIFNVRHNELTRSHVHREGLRTWERVIHCGNCGDFA